MKCLTVCQPWAHLLIFGRKRVENRTWGTAYRGPLIIHAGKSRAWLEDEEDWLEMYGELHPCDKDLVFGAALGVVDLVDCVRVDPRSRPSWPAFLRDDPYAEGEYCWVTANPRPLPQPYPMRGLLGLFNAPPELAASPGRWPPISTDGRTRVVNVRHAEPGSYVYVGRAMFRHPNPAIRDGSIWGNPFRISPDGDIYEVLAKYRQYVLDSPELMAQLHTLRGNALGCWCAPQPCHADVLVELLVDFEETMTAKGYLSCSQCGRRFWTKKTTRLCSKCSYERLMSLIRESRSADSWTHGAHGDGDFCGGYALPAEPTAATPGSDEKIEALSERVMARVSLWHPLDKGGD